jgi:hypothetical protein
MRRNSSNGKKLKGEPAVVDNNRGARIRFHSSQQRKTDDTESFQLEYRFQNKRVAGEELEQMTAFRGAFGRPTIEPQQPSHACQIRGWSL